MGGQPNRISRELRALFAPLRGHERSVVICAGALALLLIHLHQGSRFFFAEHLAPLCLPAAAPLEVEWWAALYQHAVAFGLFFLIPLAVFRWVGREKLSQLGLGLGDWKTGFGWVAPLGLLLISLPAGYSAASMPDFVAEYPLAKLAGTSASRFVLYQLAYGLLYYVAYEAFFRGMLQFGLRAQLGEAGAILVQTAMTTLLHINKPQGEIWSALGAGLLFGLIAFRVRSIWPLVVIHWGLGLATDLFCARAAGL
jgi:membrane protease YdiL (CAAX protease family)